MIRVEGKEDDISEKMITYIVNNGEVISLETEKRKRFRFIHSEPAVKKFNIICK